MDPLVRLPPAGDLPTGNPPLWRADHTCGYPVRPGRLADIAPEFGAVVRQGLPVHRWRMCNHYKQPLLKGAQIPGWINDLFSEIRVPLRLGNVLPGLKADVYPDREGLVIVQGDEGPELDVMRWGFPPVKGPVVTNVRNLSSTYWRGWLKPEWRCLVPATSFFEYDERQRGKGRMPEAEFSLADAEGFYFAGAWRPWTGARGTKANPVEGEHRLYAFLTCKPNAEVAPIHPKAMPVILTGDDARAWLTAPVQEATAMQRPLPNGMLAVAE